MNDVAALIVNYNSGWLCASAVRSLRAQSFTGKDGGPGKLQIVVVDNASPEDQRAQLEPLAAQGVEVIWHGENVGYGRGMNLGMYAVDAEFVLIANPDVLVLDGALQAFCDLLRSDPRVGAAGPRGYLDPDLFVQLPPNDLPTLSLHALESIGRVHRSVARRAARSRSRRFLSAWRTPRPIRLPMISGFAMFLRASLARRLGPFDPHFPFYFEDADLCRRVARAGYDVVLEPRARMIHFFDQSARSARAEVLKKYAVSRSRYYRKHYGALGARLFDALERYAGQRADAAQGWRFHPIEDLGDVADAPVLEIPGATEWVLEIATDPAFLFCGGHLGNGARAEIPPRAWNALEATRWYLRALDVRTLAIVRYVTFRKTRHATGPVAFEEFLALQSAAASP